MNKSYIYLFFLLVTFSCSAEEFNTTQAYFISLTAMSRQREVHLAMDAIKNKLVVEKTTYVHDGMNYSIENFTFVAEYLDSKQKVEIFSDNNVSVSGGRVEFSYEFNWKHFAGGLPAAGTARGSVVSDPLSYSKAIDLDAKSGFPYWKLIGNVSELTISDRFSLKRFEPFDQTNHDAISVMLDRALNITPSTVKQQILEHWNSAFPYALNQTLNHEVIGENIEYSFDHVQHGKINMTIVHENFGFDVTKEDGMKFIFRTEIDGLGKITCDKPVPEKHLTWEHYGGTQNIHMICLYQEVLEYLQAKGWLDIVLGEAWEVSAFQFYAGDLFDLINNLYVKVSPREELKGECKASKDGLKIGPNRDVSGNLVAEVSYDCSIQTRTTADLKNITVLNFKANAKIDILIKAAKSSLEFSISQSKVSSPTFLPADEYYVNNVPLATFKINEVLSKLKGTKVFGTGFPTLHHEYPATEIDSRSGYVVYYDGSHAALPRESEN